MDYPLDASDALTTYARKIGLKTWPALINHVCNLPYGRNSNRSDFSLVLKESKGTCSSKHAMLKQIAVNNDIPNIKLILGIYKMNHHNTPKIGIALKDTGLDYVPEAHCYLKVEDVRYDYTLKDSDPSKVFQDLMEEIEIEAFQVSEYKVKWHKNFVKNWLLESGLVYSFEELWEIREACIENITNNN